MTHVISNELETKIELVTPQRARNILELNVSNRSIIKNNLERLVFTIKNNQWKMNGDSIRISKTNKLLDGQHRLMAIVESGIPCECLIITGLNDDVFTTIDQGSARTLGHILSTRNVKNYNIAASVVPILIQYEKGFAPAKVRLNGITKNDMTEFYFNNKEIIDNAAEFVSSKKVIKAWFTPSYGCLLYILFNSIDTKMADTFFKAVEGDNSELLNCQQADVLRNKMILISAASVKDTALNKSAYAVVAWNYFRKGKKCKLLRWVKDGPAAQKYPRAI